MLRPTPRRHPWLALFAGQLAVAAWVGALGLVVGFLSLPDQVAGRLPFASTTLGGAALALVVGAPATVLTVLAWRGARSALPAAAATGVLLVAWILIELAVVRELSFLQPFYAAEGVVLVVWAQRGALERRT